MQQEDKERAQQILEALLPQITETLQADESPAGSYLAEALAKFAETETRFLQTGTRPGVGLTAEEAAVLRGLLERSQTAVAPPKKTGFSLPPKPAGAAKPAQFKPKKPAAAPEPEDEDEEEEPEPTPRKFRVKPKGESAFLTEEERKAQWRQQQEAKQEAYRRRNTPDDKAPGYIPTITGEAYAVTAMMAASRQAETAMAHRRELRSSNVDRLTDGDNR